MCYKEIFKSLLITISSFFLFGSIYLVTLADFLWPSTIDPTDHDVSEDYFILGLFGSLLCSPTLIAVVRNCNRVLKYHGYMLIVPAIIFVVLFIVKLAGIQIILFHSTLVFFALLALGTTAYVVVQLVYANLLEQEENAKNEVAV